MLEDTERRDREERQRGETERRDRYRQKKQDWLLLPERFPFNGGKRGLSGLSKHR